MHPLLSTQIVTEFIVFVILAAVRTLILDIFAWRLLVDAMVKRPWSWIYVKRFGINVFAYSHAIMFIISSTASYLLNRYITFQTPHVSNEVISAMSFFTINIITLILSVIFLNWLTSTTPLQHIFFRFPLVASHWAMLSKIFTIGVIMVLNYLGYRFFVF